MQSRILITLTIVFLIFGIANVGMAQSQNVKKVKLPNGEEVVDISGEWDTQVENYGLWSHYGKYPTITEIKQKGSSFVGIRLKATPYHPVGSVMLRGELDKKGIKKLVCITGYGPMDAVGRISDDAKTIMIDIPNRARTTMKKK